EENLPIFLKQEAEINANTNTALSLSAAMEKAEKEILRNALLNYKSTRAIAKVLQVSQPTIVRKLHKYGLTGPNAVLGEEE
ncbi:MAG: TyrR/PhhR family helix-turn-helix DNA-binding protein, partial [Anaerovoracaceae bacterium]